MKSSLISKHRLKILVSAAELKKNEQEENRRKTIESFISAACKQTGFSYSDCRLMIETIPSSEGGCTICVTRLPGRRHTIQNMNGGVYLVNEPYIFEFDSLDYCIAAGRELVRHQSVLMSDINIIFCKEKWYISFMPVLEGLDGYRLDCLLGCIYEFGKEIRGGIIREKRLMEQGKLIAANSSAEHFFFLIDQALVSSAPSISELTALSTSLAPNT